MAINVNNVWLRNLNASDPQDRRRFQAQLPSNATLEVDVDGNVTSSGDIYFYSYINSSVWTALPNATWARVPLNTVGVQLGGSNFDTANNRFTAPKHGLYYFTAGSYISVQTANSGYVHPVFRVNGSQTARKDNGTNLLTDVDYRIRRHGYPNIANPPSPGPPGQNSSVDSNISQLLYLYQGDFVEYWIYSNTSSNQYYTGYTMMNGVYLGCYI